MICPRIAHLVEFSSEPLFVRPSRIGFFSLQKRVEKQWTLQIFIKTKSILDPKKDMDGD